MAKKNVVRKYRDFDTDFESSGREPRRISSDYKYRRDRGIDRILSFICYRIIATPIAAIYTKLILKERYVGREKLRGIGGCVVYANHNECIGDAFTPSVALIPRRCYTVVHPDNVTLPVLGRITPYLGALPLPSDVRTTRRFTETVGHHLGHGHTVVIYPERHVWQGYGGIRPFGSVSFDFVVRFDCPAFVLTRTYKRTRRGHRAVTYIDGPFYPEVGVPKREAAEIMCHTVYGVMCERARLTDCEPIIYIKDAEND